jgi:hypothetical protein
MLAYARSMSKGRRIVVNTEVSKTSNYSSILYAPAKKKRLTWMQVVFSWHSYTTKLEPISSKMYSRAACPLWADAPRPENPLHIF